MMPQESSAEHQPILLLPHVHVPTYQLSALAGRPGQQDTVLKMVILETMKWLRQRFRAFELPAELEAPEADRHEEWDMSCLQSFRLDLGYKLEVIWLADAGIWVMQLTEPDLGVGPDSVSPERAPVPGRLFETNVAYRKTQEGVACGFQTVVHEPVGTDTPAEVFRLAFIKNLARHRQIGLKHGWPIVDHAHVLNTRGDLKTLRSWLQSPERMLPAVIISERTEAKPSISIFDLPREMPQRGLATTPVPPEIVPVKPPAEPTLPFTVTDLTRYKMGYAQFFVLPVGQLSSLVELTGQRMNSGDVLILEPNAFGGRSHRYSYSTCAADPEGTCQVIDRFVQNYPRGKEMVFRDCVFMQEAKELEREHNFSLHRSVKETMDLYEGKLVTIVAEHRLERYRLLETILEKESKISRLQQSIQDGDRNKERSRQENEERVMALRKQLMIKDRTIDRLEQLRDRPEKAVDVSGWVERRFAGKLIFHPRAMDLMVKIPPDKVNLPLLCHALEYLAEEYRDHRIGRLSEVERDDLCSVNYGRPFEVVCDRGPTIDKYSQAYKIKYRKGHKGKPVECALDLHLKVGNDADNLLRIYFLYDREEQLIVVGSLPEHLPTVSFK